MIRTPPVTLALALALTACARSPRPAPAMAQETAPHAAASSPGAPAAAPSLAASDRAAIVAAVENIARGADLRQWDDVAASFADLVVLDYGSPELLRREEIVARWRPLLGAFDATQHALRDVQVAPADGRARVRASFRATHRLAGAEGGDEWALEGRYEYELVPTESGWKVDRMRMIPGASSGNAGLLAAARRKAGVAEAPAATAAERVTFASGGDTLVGWVLRPARPAAAPLPAVVVTGAWITVKEQMPLRYARKLAEAGYAALVFDFRGYGESGGAPRAYESPARKTDDIAAAAAFLRGHRGVDGARVGLLGVCASAGYAAAAAARHGGVRSLALVAPWLHDGAIARQVYGARFDAKLAAGRRARDAFEARGEVRYVPAASATDAAAAMHAPADVLDYYLNPARGVIPQWDNRFAEMSWAEWLAFDGIASAPRVRAPVRVVHSEAAAIPQGARQFYAGLAGRKDLVWLEGRTQFHFYDDEPTVAEAVRSVAEHFRATL